MIIWEHRTLDPDTTISYSVLIATLVTSPSCPYRHCTGWESVLSLATLHTLHVVSAEPVTRYSPVLSICKHVTTPVWQWMNTDLKDIILFWCDIVIFNGFWGGNGNGNIACKDYHGFGSGIFTEYKESLWLTLSHCYSIPLYIVEENYRS